MNPNHNHESAAKALEAKIDQALRERRSDDPLLDSLVNTVPRGTRRPDARLLALLDSAAAEKEQNTDMMMEKPKNRPRARIPLTLAAALIAVLLGGLALATLPGGPSPDAFGLGPQEYQGSLEGFSATATALIVEATRAAVDTGSNALDGAFVTATAVVAQATNAAVTLLPTLMPPLPEGGEARLLAQHPVRAGDTLYAIVMAYGYDGSQLEMLIPQIASLNGISVEQVLNLQAGQTLLIPLPENVQMPLPANVTATPTATATATVIADVTLPIVVAVDAPLTEDQTGTPVTLLVSVAVWGEEETPTTMAVPVADGVIVSQRAVSAGQYRLDVRIAPESEALVRWLVDHNAVMTFTVNE